MYRWFPLHLLVIFVTGPSLHCLEGNSLECSIWLSATHPLCSDLHPLLPDGVHKCKVCIKVRLITDSDHTDKIFNFDMIVKFAKARTLNCVPQCARVETVNCLVDRINKILIEHYNFQR